MMKNSCSLCLIASLVVLAGCSSTREPVEAKPPELTIGGGVSVGGAVKISKTGELPPSWTEPLVGASEPALAAREVDLNGGFLNRLAELEELVEAGVAEGQFTQTDLAQVRARRARAEAEFAQSIGALGIARAQLEAVVGPGISAQ